MQAGRTGGELIAIGFVLGAHGVQGDVRVDPLTDYPQRFKRGLRVWVQARDERIPLVRRTVQRVAPWKRGLIVRLSGVSSRLEAETLAGSYLKVGREDLFPLPEGAFYVFDIIGLNVVSLDGRAVGTVSDVLKTGANDVYVVKPADGGKDILIPAVRAVVKSIDLASRTMTVELPEGLIEPGAEGR